VSWYQKGKINLDFTETRDNEWQWHQLDHMQVCTMQITVPAPHHSVFTGRTPFLPPNQQRQSTEGNLHTYRVGQKSKLLILSEYVNKMRRQEECKQI